MVSGLSKWTVEMKTVKEKGGIDYIGSKPILCDCGYKHPIGDGTGFASFFFVNNEWICNGCGYVLEPPARGVYLWKRTYD